jgi:hypothetical protein
VGEGHHDDADRLPVPDAHQGHADLVDRGVPAAGVLDGIRDEFGTNDLGFGCVVSEPAVLQGCPDQAPCDPDLPGVGASTSAIMMSACIAVLGMARVPFRACVKGSLHGRARIL